MADLVSAPERSFGSTDFTPCDGNDLQLLQSSSQTTATVGSFVTTFVLRFTGSTLCSVDPGFYVVDMTAADGTIVPIDVMPVGPIRAPLDVRPGQFVFGTVQWTVKPGLPLPTHLTFRLGGTPTSQPMDLSVADALIPTPSPIPDPDSASQSAADALLTSAADPASLATLTATVAAPSSVGVPSTLKDSVTLTNLTDIAVPLTGCPQFAEQLSVVPSKLPITVGARGLLNCAQLPPTIPEHSSVTMLMQLDTAGQVTGPGRLTWQLLDHDNLATAADTTLTVQ